MQDIHRFEATYVTCFSENDVDIIGLSDDDHVPDHFVVLMQLKEEGLSLAQCTELQTEAAEFSITGAVQAINLTSQRLSITLSAIAQKQLGYNVIDVVLPKQYAHQQLEEYLHVCFDDASVALTITNRE